ncbi:hypothetical protein M8C21_003498, partial [Ambrosia artemisiifolia]
IEEIGWEHLLKLAEDLSDKKERVHVLEILLDKSYPNCPPSVSADVPYLFDLEWSRNSRLNDVVKQFRQHLEKLQQFWSAVEDIDQSLWVYDSAQLHRATSFRHINIGNDCSIMLHIRANEPRSLPENRENVNLIHPAQYNQASPTNAAQPKSNIIKHAVFCSSCFYDLVHPFSHVCFIVCI